MQPGDVYAITCGEPMGAPGGTNMLKICRGQLRHLCIRETSAGGIPDLKSATKVTSRLRSGLRSLSRGISMALVSMRELLDHAPPTATAFQLSTSTTT